MRITERGLQITFDGALVGVTALLAVIAIKQVNVATRAAKAAENANALARRALTSVQRAFISETNIEILGGHGPAAQSLQESSGGVAQGIGKGNLTEGAVLIQFQNSGSTPGIKVIENANVCVRTKDIPKDFSYRDLSDINRHNRTYIAPKTDFFSYTPLTSDQVEGILTLKSVLYVWGWITYDDVFGKHHRSEYCARYQGVWKGLDKSFTWIADQCTPSNPHSCTDKNCEKKWGDNDKIDCDNHQYN